MVQAFTRGPVEMEVEKGGPFCLFGGMVRGRFTELVSTVSLDLSVAQGFI